MALQIRNGSFEELARRLGGVPVAGSGEGEIGRARVMLEGGPVLLIAYDRSSDARNRGYRGRKPDQTVSVRGAPPEECSKLEALLRQDYSRSEPGG